MESLATLSTVLLFWTIIMDNTRIHAQYIHVPETTGTLLYKASEQGDLAEVKRLAGDTCEAVNDPYMIYGGEIIWTPLHAAASHNHTDVVLFLLSCNADPNAQTFPFKTTPLMMASQKGASHISVVNALLTANPELNIQDDRGMTALLTASAYWNTYAVKALIAAGAEVNLQMQNGATALMGASAITNIEAAKALITAGAQLDLQDNKGQTALMYASIYRLGIELDAELPQDSGTPPDNYYSYLISLATDAAFALRRMGADTDHLYSALLSAATDVHVDLTIILLEHGADINIQDHDGKSALHWAAEKNLTEQVAALLQHGANVRIKSNSGDTAADIARNKGFMNIHHMINQYTDTSMLNNVTSGNEMMTLTMFMMWDAIEVVNLFLITLMAG